MIGYFPELYEDELIYSWIARYLVHSGYTSAADTYQDLYFNKNLRPSVELMNNMLDDAKTVMTKYMSMEDLIHKHTLFPEYGRFIDPTKREKLVSEADFSRGNWINSLMIPTSIGERYLKYCPLCVKEDRDSHGEAFWHRKHQIIGIKICTKHKVYLQDSEVLINRNLTRLKAAEIIIPRETIITKCEDEIIIKLAIYMVAVFENEKYGYEQIGRYINSQIPSKYLYDNGNRKMYALYADYTAFYKTLDTSELMSENSMCRLLGGHRAIYAYICQLGLMLDIDPSDLITKGKEQDYDIFQRVSQMTGEPVEHVRIIGEAVIDELKKESVQFIKGTRHKDNIDQADLDLLPRLQEAVINTYGDGDTRPRKISISQVSKAVHVDSHRLKKMKRCMEFFNQYYESQEEYWARELVWAVKKTEREGDNLSFSHIQDLTNLRRDNMVDSMEKLKSLDRRIYDVLVSLL